MITLHHLNSSRSHRILWMMEELGIPYEIKTYQRNSMGMAPAELKAVHPLGKSPVITDSEITVAESGAIIEYLIETYGQGRLKPAPGTKEARWYTFYLHYAEGSVMPPLLVSLLFGRISKPPMPFFLRPVGKMIEAGVRKAYIDPTLQLHFDFIEKELSERPWLAGDEFSAADIQMSFVLKVGTRRFGLARYPRIKSFLERIEARPAYQRAIEVGGPLEILS